MVLKVLSSRLNIIKTLNDKFDINTLIYNKKDFMYTQINLIKI